MLRGMREILGRRKSTPLRLRECRASLAFTSLRMMERISVKKPAGKIFLAGILLIPPRLIRGEAEGVE